MDKDKQEAVNKFLTEEMGKCWHEWEKGYGYFYTCEKCNQEFEGRFPYMPNYFIWEGFGILWNWAKGQEWWYTAEIEIEEEGKPRGFIQVYGIVECNSDNIPQWGFPEKYIDPIIFPIKLAEFLGWKEEL